MNAPPAIHDLREAVAQWLESEVGLYVSEASEKAGEFCGPSGPIASVHARLTVERDDAEQRVTNLANALASAHRARGEQERRADEADDRRVTLEKDRIHPAFSVEAQEHRQQAYESGWSDGYAEGFAKAQAAAEAELTTLKAAAARDAEEALRSRDFQMMLLARVIRRHSKGLDITATMAGARDLLARKGTLSPFRSDAILTSPENADV